MNESRQISKIIHCPKCNSSNIFLHEITSHSISWIQKPDGKLEDLGHEPGNIEKVLGECISCKNRWKVRKINQLSFK